jgi:hypothetical protein
LAAARGDVGQKYLKLTYIPLKPVDFSGTILHNSATPMPSPPSMFDEPRAAKSTASPDDYIQPNFGHGFRIWWAFYWRTSLSSIPPAVVVILLLRRFSDDLPIPLISKYVISVFYYLASFFVMGYILRKNFRHFRVGLLSNHRGDGAQPLPPTLRRTARVWWIFCWRTVVYRIIAAVAVSFPLGWTMGFLSAILPGRAAFALINTSVQILLDAAVGMYVIYSNILDEDISDFRVALLPRAELASSATTARAPVILSAQM